MMKKLSILPNKRQKINKHLSDSTETPKDSSALPPEQILPRPSYHHTCKTLPLESFIQAYCNDDLSGLIIEGIPHPAMLREAFNDVILDYLSLFKTEQGDYIFSLDKEMSGLRRHIAYVDAAIRQYLKPEYNLYQLTGYYEEDKHNKIIEGLAEYGYFTQSIEDENYIQSLDRITSLAKTKVFELENLTDEYNRLNNTLEGKRQTEDEFIMTVAMLSKYQGYSIDTFTTTVYRFVMTFNNYLSEMKVLNNANAR